MTQDKEVPTMPKVQWLLPPEQKAVADELRERYGGMMRSLDIQVELSVNKDTARKWLHDVPAVNVRLNQVCGGRPKIS